MDLVSSLPLFVLAVLVACATPGPAMALVLRRAALRGFRRTLPVVLGLELGLYLWALLAAAGVAALVAASEVAFLVLRMVGAAVLIVLGVRAWRAAWRERAGGPGHGEPTPAPTTTTTGGGWRAFGEGLMVQLANPKAAVFAVAFYPQFVPADRPLFATTAALAGLQVALEIVLYLGLIAGVARAGAWFRRPVVRRRMEAVTGTVLVGLGVRVAATSH